MINTIKLFFEEIKVFSKGNWWIYIIFTFCLVIIYKTNTWNIFEISLVFIFHFLGDLFVMMMAYYFSIKDNKNWSIFQILNFIIFFSIAIYASITSWKFHYLLYQPSFVLPTIKWYFHIVKNKNLKYLNWQFSLFINIIIVYMSYTLWLLKSYPIIIQMIWFSWFSIALILDNEKYKYFLSLFWIFAMVIWSWYLVYSSFLISDIKWIDVSYTLLPFTVFVFYLKNIGKYL